MIKKPAEKSHSPKSVGEHREILSLGSATIGCRKRPDGIVGN